MIEIPLKKYQIDGNVKCNQKELNSFFFLSKNLEKKSISITYQNGVIEN